MSFGLEYRSVETAVEAARQRLGDKNLQDKVAAFLGNIWPRGFEDAAREPALVYAPYLARGAGNEIASAKLAQELGVGSVTATYEADEFVTANQSAVDCYRVPMQLPNRQQRRLWVVLDEDRRGKIGEARTIYPDLNIIQYLQGIRFPVLEQAEIPRDGRVVDFSEWYDIQAKRFGWQGERQKSPYYYIALMALYASGRAILMDTPPTAYASMVMQPAAERVEAELGVYPLLTNVLVGGRDWTDLSFLDTAQAERLLREGKVE